MRSLATCTGEEMDEGQQLTGDDFVDDCSIESDLEMYFPDTYVPGSSERMLLYRELDRIENDDDWLLTESESSTALDLCPVRVRN